MYQLELNIYKQKVLIPILDVAFKTPDYVELKTEAKLFKGRILSDAGL